MQSDEQKAEIFERHRGRLFGLAYRMLGTHAEAEDIVQEAYLKWHGASAAEIETPEAWLVTVTTRLAIDRLRKASRERETYIGPWLPEPLLISEAASPAEELELASNLSLAFLALLERLAPVERAAFLLHDIFDLGYAEIARIVGKTETASRQLIHRARSRVRSDKPRFAVDDAAREKLIRQFSAASQAGDEATLRALFSDEISLASDGGGKVNSARKIVSGKERVARLFALTAVKFGRHWRHELVRINGELGLLTYEGEKLGAVTTFDFADEKIVAVYRVMNPDKLQALQFRHGDTERT